MTPDTISAQITDYANRADPYPLYAELRKTPVKREDDGTYLVSTYHEVRSLANDPRLSNDTRNRPPGYARPGQPAEETGLPPSFIFTDPPLHDQLRSTINRPFGPPHSPRFLDGLRGELATVVTELLDAFDGKDQVDIVEDFSYPLPVTAICKVLGVPREDEPRFHVWADALASSLDPHSGDDGGPEKAQRARQDLGAYLADLIEAKRRHPGPGILSALAPDMTPADLEATAVLLLVAGHETTVNAITNTTLTLLRHPDVLQRFQKEPELAVPIIEEVLRYEPPVQFVPWTTALADIDIAGTTIPKGSPIWLMVAAANRDPRRFKDPDRFDPDRKDNEHLGFYTGIHYCFGAPLARIELHVAVPELFRRVKFSGLLQDPPPYRANAVLRGPRHLPVAIEGN
ncbi:Cytochrome P450 [Streptomyces sp. OV198]|jgi:cytochrome P450|uniref:cytochrome P450 n=1 Tax=unclassified Streptomyces TaxID=2593676 RepID=UPI000BB1316B|nr:MULTISPECIES: cytochrome P450 [unclassified Streptomyces]PBC92985.1 cytochrome P450 [Streptomyces sp. Ag82_O1-15]SOF02885.1 Cytochrome P450 [Streptomyces sp. OV198]